MEVTLFNIASEKTSNPQQLADLEQLRRSAMRVVQVERERTAASARHQINKAVLDELDDADEARVSVFALQSRFCRRADTATEAIQSIVGFERDELDFLHLLSDLSGQSEQRSLQPLIRSKEELITGMQQFVSTWN